MANIQSNKLTGMHKCSTEKKYLAWIVHYNTGEKKALMKAVKQLPKGPVAINLMPNFMYLLMHYYG